MKLNAAGIRTIAENWLGERCLGIRYEASKTAILSGWKVNPRALLIICILYGGLISSPKTFADRSSTSPGVISRAVQLQDQVDSQSRQIAPNGTPWFRVYRGCIPVIVTAPHATRPFRQGQYRFSDGGGTAALANALHETAGVTAIFTVYESPSDPNFYDDNDFKLTVRRIIDNEHPRLLLDIHASAPERPYDVDLGTMNGLSLMGQLSIRDDLVAVLRRNGVRTISIDFFSAARNGTITKFASSLGVPAVQLEINSAWLVPGRSELSTRRFGVLVRALTAYLRSTFPLPQMAGRDEEYACR